MQRGFTLVELIVVVFIILILTAVVLGNYQSGGQRLALQRSAAKLAQDFRLVQERAMSAEYYSTCPNNGGYGIYLHATAAGANQPGPGAYLLFVDCTLDKEFDVGSEPYEKISFESGVEFKRAYFGGDNNPHATVIFSPPEPSVFIKSESDEPDSIRLKLEINSQEVFVYINKAGLVYVE